MTNKDDVLKIASLARISISPDEMKTVTENFFSILGYVEQLKQTDVSGVEPMTHVHGASNVFREDKVTEGVSPEEMLSNAPDRSGRYLRVPIIVGE